MTLIEQLDLLEDLLARGGWIEGMECVEEEQEILDLLRQIYATAEKLEGGKTMIH